MFLKVLVLAVAVGVGLYLGGESPSVTGGSPLLHLFIPYNMTLESIPRLDGKVYIVTGANSGLGKSLSKIIAGKANAKVIMGCRSMTKCEGAADEIRTEYPAADLHPMEIDLASQKSTRKFAKAFLDMNVPLSGLVLNAGIVMARPELTEDGIEKTLAVNHVSHQLLVELLLDKLKQSVPSTVVTVSSASAWLPMKGVDGGIPTDLKVWNDEEKFDSMQWYGATKLANIMFAMHLNKLLGPDVQVFSNSAHPGMSASSMFDNVYAQNETVRTPGASLMKVFHYIHHALSWETDMGALAILKPAVSPQGSRGLFFAPIGRVVEPPPQAKDERKNEQLWNFTASLYSHTT